MFWTPFRFSNERFPCVNELSPLMSVLILTSISEDLSRDLFSSGMFNSSDFVMLNNFSGDICVGASLISPQN